MGIDLGTSTITTAASNNGRMTPPKTALTTWKSDYKYIMWREGDDFTADKTDFTRWALAAQNGKDPNFIYAIALTGSSIFL